MAWNQAASGAAPLTLTLTYDPPTNNRHRTVNNIGDRGFNMDKPMTDKDFAFTMARLLRQKKYGLYKLAVEKRKKWLSENRLTGQTSLPIDK